jgi:hypothetical protein
MFKKYLLKSLFIDKCEYKIVSNIIFIKIEKLQVCLENYFVMPINFLSNIKTNDSRFYLA